MAAAAERNLRAALLVPEHAHGASLFPVHPVQVGQVLLKMLLLRGAHAIPVVDKVVARCLFLQFRVIPYSHLSGLLQGQHASSLGLLPYLVRRERPSTYNVLSLFTLELKFF